MVSYAFAGLGSLLVLFVYRSAVRQLRLIDWACAALLGFLGYIGYFFLITTAVLAAGPVMQRDHAGLEVHHAAAASIYPSLAANAAPARALSERVAPRQPRLASA